MLAITPGATRAVLVVALPARNADHAVILSLSWLVLREIRVIP